MTRKQHSLCHTTYISPKGSPCVHACPQVPVAARTLHSSKGSKAPFPLPLWHCLTGVRPVTLHLDPQGATARGVQASQLTGSSSFAPCPCSSLSHFFEQLCFPRTGFYFFLIKKNNLSLDGLTKVRHPFVFLILLFRGRKKRRKEGWERSGTENQPK